MPTLTLRDNPCQTYPAGVQWQDIEGPWSVVTAYPGHAKILAHRLAAARVPYWLPMEEVVCVRDGRRRKMMRLPLGRYLFVAGKTDPESEQNQPYHRLERSLDIVWGAQHLCGDRLHRLTTELRRIRHQAALLRDMEGFCHWINVPAVERDAQWLRVGVRARITEGPWVNHEGTVLESDGRLCFTIAIQAFGRDTPLEIRDPAMLEPLN